MLIITGGSKGIGKSIVEKFLNEQYCVVNISRSAMPHVDNIQADLSSSNSEEVITARLREILTEKSLIGLVHNVSAHFHDAIGRQTKTQLMEALNMGVIMPALLNNHVIPYMSPGSSIIYIGSTLSEKAVKNAATYVISKHAIAGMMKATCQDLSNDAIHTCCICPGFTETEMLREHLGNNLDFAKHKVGAGRLIQPHEIAEIVYFASHHPTLNGSVIHANLGQLET